jgi:hypothetical protein
MTDAADSSSIANGQGIQSADPRIFLECCRSITGFSPPVC